jgi:hypothetical protein
MSTTRNFKKNRVKILTARIFSKILYKINSSNREEPKQLLGIDLLRTPVQKDLLCMTVLRVEETYTKLLGNGNPLEIMQKEGEILFLQCTKKSCEDFLTKYYGSKVKVNLGTLKKLLYTKSLIKDIEVLFQVPFYILLDTKSPIFCSIYYPVYDFPSEGFIEALIENMILEISNCVIYFSIVQFSSIYAFRQTLYRARFLSLRNFERFKNNLNWKLMTKNYVQRPIDLYNSRYEILILRSNGINSRVIYANRSKDITLLNNLSLLTIILVESKDFVVSRIDEAIFIASRITRFTLTTFFGKIIGLIWRGIIDGLKN